MIFHRFVPAGATSADVVAKTDDVPTKPLVPDKVTEIKMVRTKSTWLPCQLLCYKMNIEAAVGYDIRPILTQLNLTINFFNF